MLMVLEKCVQVIFLQPLCMTVWETNVAVLQRLKMPLDINVDLSHGVDSSLSAIKGDTLVLHDFVFRVTKIAHLLQRYLHTFNLSFASCGRVFARNCSV